MRDSRNKIITVLMLLVLVLAGCAQPDTEEIPDKTVLPEEKVVARIYLPNEGPETRTILPGRLGQADHYTLTFTKAGAEPIVQTGLRPTMGAIEIVGLTVGTYEVEARGFNGKDVLIYEGKSTGALNIESLDKIATITIELVPTIAENTTGNIQVTFDWSSLVDRNSINTASDHTELKAKGPISTAIEEGTLKFVIYTAEVGQPLIQRGEPIVWTSAEGTDYKECLFTGIPTGDNIAVAFSILDKDNNVIVDRKYSITAQVFTDQTSYWNGSEDHVLNVKSNMDKWYSNISNIQVEYPTENVDSSIILTWDARTDRQGNPIYKSIIFTVRDKETSTVVGQPYIFTPEKLKTNSITVTGLVPRKQYTVDTETISLGGKHSNTFQWTADEGKGFTTKVEVESITFAGDTARECLSTGDSFRMTASIAPADASYNLLTWTATEPDTLLITTSATSLDEDVVVTANKPGITRIKVRNNDPKVDRSAITANEITIRLAQPKNVAASFERDTAGQTSGISVSWDSVPFAESYELYRKVDAGGFVLYQTIANQVGLPSHSHLDTDLKTGSTYQYKVIAKAPSIDGKYASTHPGYSAASLESAPSAAVEVKKPQIIMKPIDFTQGTFELSSTNIGTSERNPIIHMNDIDIIRVDAGDSYKLQLAAPIAGYTDKATYTWYVNDWQDVVLSGTFAEANTIEINSTLAGLDLGENGVQELIIAVYEEGKGTQSALVHFTVIAEPVESVSFKSDRTRMATTETGLKLKAVAYPTTATLTDVYYRITSGNEIADINVNTGAITLREGTSGGKVTFEAYSQENNNIVSAPYEVTFYKPTVESPESLIRAVNTELGNLIATADGTYDNFGESGIHISRNTGDWWQAGNIAPWTNPEGTVSIKANYGASQDLNGGITFTDYRTTLGPVGEVSMTTGNGKRILVWANNEGGAGNLDRDPLNKIGATVTDPEMNRIIVTLPNFQGTATITYSEVDTLSRNSGSYTITFSDDIYVRPDYTITGGHAYPFGVVDSMDGDAVLIKGIGVPFEATHNK